MCDLAKILLSAGLGFIGGLAIPFALRWLTRFLLGPMLKVEFDVDEVEGVTEISRTPQCYFRVKVSSAKPLVARECRAYLTRIEELTNSKALLYETFQLIWSYDAKRDSFDLPRGRTPTVDVAMYELGTQTFTPCLRGADGATLKPSKFEGKFLAKGACEFTVLVSGQDIEPVTRRFRVTYDGHNWPPRGEAR